MTDLGEAALAQITSRATDYRALLHLPGHRTARDRPRHVRDFSAVRHGNALTDVVTVVESFVVARLMRLNPGLGYEQIKTWHARVQMWQQYAVVLTAFPDWQAFMGFVETRNALAHNLGRLTDLQLGKRRYEVLAQIADAGVQLNGDLLLVTSEDVQRCVELSAGVVRFVDLNAPKV
ncbi:hypothetical protein AB0M46_37860 [Dactylosporangium sp. NPDC051485]|uniref:hypothetical protein n=1 Tax=Dactylosporangium sp. NPDC051485 TaxID=3154846 RepID=UPI00341DF4FE